MNKNKKKTLKVIENLNPDQILWQYPHVNGTVTVYVPVGDELHLGKAMYLLTLALQAVIDQAKE
jgi:hypothetical protein